MSPSEEREGSTNPNRNILSAFLAVRPISDSSCLLAVRRGSWAEETWLLRLLLSPIFHQGSTHTTSCTLNFPSQPWCRCFIPMPRPGLRVLRGGCRDGVLLMEAAAVGREEAWKPQQLLQLLPGARCAPSPRDPLPSRPLWAPLCSPSSMLPQRPLPSPPSAPSAMRRSPEDGAGPSAIAAFRAGEAAGAGGAGGHPRGAELKYGGGNLPGAAIRIKQPLAMPTGEQEPSPTKPFNCRSLTQD